MISLLITGTASGLGKYLHEELGGEVLTRQTSAAAWEQWKSKGVETIVHCAFNSRRDPEDLFSYFWDNIFLTEKLLSLPHKKFIYLSSVDTYPKDGHVHSEDEMISIDSLQGGYAVSKAVSESLVKRLAKQYLILRPSSMLGKYSRPNNLKRLLEEPECRLTLSADSNLNYVLHNDVLEFLELAKEKGLQGIFNLVSSRNISFGEIAEMAGKKVSFGEYRYDAGYINNRKASALFPAFGQTSRQVLERYFIENFTSYPHVK